MINILCLNNIKSPKINSFTQIETLISENQIPSKIYYSPFLSLIRVLKTLSILMV